MKNIKHKIQVKVRNTIFFVSCLMFLMTSNVWTQELDRSQPPQLGPPPKMELPSIQRLELSNGLKVVMMEYDLDYNWKNILE